MSDKNDPTKAPDTGHLWDDNLRELTNPPPRWWLNTLYLSVIFFLIYIVLYPSIPLLSGSTKGVLGWTQIKEYKEDLNTIEEIRAPFENKIKAMSATEVIADRELAAYISRAAKVLFGDRCAPCHGTGGAGNLGYPVLADDDWLYGGNVETIIETISNGRMGMMPGFSAMMSEADIDNIAQHVLALSQGSEHAAGKALYENAGCAGCHGADAKGIQMMGSANLTDAIWRFSPGTLESIKYTVANGINSPGTTETRQAVMPVFSEQLSELEIKKLAIYVYMLGGGQ